MLHAASDPVLVPNHFIKCTLIEKKQKQKQTTTCLSPVNGEVTPTHLQLRPRASVLACMVIRSSVVLAERRRVG